MEKGVARMSICEHCRHYKTKKLNGKIVSECCKKRSNRLHDFIECDMWSRSWKSRLGLVKELHQ